MRRFRDGIFDALLFPFKSVYVVCAIGYYIMILRLFEQVVVALICFIFLPWLQFALNFDDLSVGHRIIFAFFHLQNILIEAYVISTVCKIVKKKKRQLEVIKKASKTARMDRLHLPPTFYDIGSFNLFFYIHAYN